jgi:surface antigen
MRVRGNVARSLILGSLLTLQFSLLTHPSDAATKQKSQGQVAQSARASGKGVAVSSHGKALAKGHRYARAGGGISCVPFARSDSGIDVAGNAWQWWDNAAGVYARGSVPEAGSVLTFRSNGRMRLGHVAVVSRVVNARMVEIDHANWWGPGMRGGVARNIPVVDVSENNDWTAVRVGLGYSGDYGSVYPTYGFIYDRADSGTMIASKSPPAPTPELNPAPNDLRPAAERGWQAYEEVAEAPVAPRNLKRKYVHQVAARTTTATRKHH